MGIPTISERKYICWLPDPPSEPTSTLVLTSHTSHYVDIRIYKPTSRLEPQGNLSNDDDSVPILEWAFAGTSITTKALDTGIPHTVWTHWLDSKSEDPAKDEGDMYIQPGGDALECGMGISPHTGKMTNYEELWHDLGIGLVDTETEHVCIVLKAESSTPAIKGMVVRIGGWCQGIIKSGKEMSVERWKWISETTLETEDSASEQVNIFPSKLGVWQRVMRLGSERLPCSLTFQVDYLEEGDTIKSRDLQWVVVEKYRW